MTSNTRLNRFLGLILITASLHACSQMGGGPGGPGDPGGRGGASDSGPRSVSASRNPLFDEMQWQIEETATQLKLRPDQRPLWDAYMEKVGALMADQMRPTAYANADPKTGKPTKSALQQIDAKVDLVRNRLAALEDIADAAQRIYLSFDTQQREIADQALAATVPNLYSGLGRSEPLGGSRGSSGPGGPGGAGGPGGGKGRSGG